MPRVPVSLILFILNLVADTAMHLEPNTSIATLPKVIHLSPFTGDDANTSPIQPHY